MTGLTRLLALLCAVLMLAPSESRAATIQTGVGYVQAKCRTIGDADEKACLTGERLNLGLNFPLKVKDDPERASTPEKKAKGSRWGGVNWFSGSSSDGVIVILALILLIFGIIWLITAILSNRISAGLYSSFDFQSVKLKGESDTSVEKYRSQSAGVQAMFYLFRDMDFVLNVGVAGTTAQIATSSATDGDRNYNLRGISSKAGLGYVPFMDNGVYGMLEFEGAFFNSTSVSKYVRENADAHLPVTRKSTAFVLGWTF